MATHSSVLAWRILEMGEPGGLPSMGSHRVGHDWNDLAANSVSYNSKFLSAMILQVDLGVSQLCSLMWSITLSVSCTGGSKTTSPAV